MARCTGSPTGPTRRSPTAGSAYTPCGVVMSSSTWGWEEKAVGPSADTNGPASTKLTGLRSRLASHASGRRSGDQFCIYVFDRLVLPALSLQQIQDAARGQLSLDGLTRQLIRQSLSYRFTVVSDAVTARAVEREIQREGLANGPPLLNPLPRSSKANS